MRLSDQQACAKGQAEAGEHRRETTPVRAPLDERNGLEFVQHPVAHPTMTWTGTNFDILPGLSALLLCPFADRLKPRSLQAWNVAMAVVLVFTVVTAILAGPTPFRQIGGEPPNVFVARFPFVWLPGVLVTSAWLGHIVLFRRLRRSAEA